MGVGDIINLMRGGIYQIFILALPPLSVALALGLVVAIMQAVTSVQEQTLTFLVKFVSILVILLLMCGWMFTHLSEYTIHLFEMIPGLAR